VRGRIHERSKHRFACLVALHEDRGLLDCVVGTADVRVPAPDEALPAAYISNVCVDVDSRRLGAPPAPPWLLVTSPTCAWTWTLAAWVRLQPLLRCPIGRCRVGNLTNPAFFIPTRGSR
jgi:hypothetical protein